MKPSKSEFRELDHNIRGEEIAIRDYWKFLNNLVKNGRRAEANRVSEILNEESVHRVELLQIKKAWKAMK